MVLRTAGGGASVLARPVGARVRPLRSPISAPPLIERGEVHVNLDRCKGCELCIACCPNGVLTLSTSFNAAGYHYPIAAEGCILCQGCTTVCPDFAITVSAAGTAPPLRDASPSPAAGGER